MRRTTTTAAVFRRGGCGCGGGSAGVVKLLEIRQLSGVRLGERIRGAA